MQALKELCSRYLYKTKNVHINKEYNNALGEKNNNTLRNKRYDSTYDTENESEDDRPIETLIHGFTDSQHVHDLQDKILEVAPAEVQRPLGIFKDTYAEDMNFPVLFYGDPRDNDIVDRFSHQKTIKWEL